MDWTEPHNLGWVTVLAKLSVLLELPADEYVLTNETEVGATPVCQLQRAARSG